MTTRTMMGNLRWTRSGTVWADWILTGLPYGLRPLKDKHMVRNLHTALLRSLPGEALLMGVQSGLDPAAVVARMLEDVDLEACPDWVDECEATLDSLDHLGLGQRVYWLSVPLGNTSRQRFTEPLRSARSQLRDWLGLAQEAIPASERDLRCAQAARVQEAIPAPFEPVPATRAQMIWLHRHHLTRGLWQDLNLPDPGDEVTTHLLTHSGAALHTPWTDEGGQSDLESAKDRFNPMGRRYVKVVDSAAADAAASYQQLLVVTGSPDAGSTFPGAEILGRLDESGVDVDWALRLTTRSSAEVKSANSRALHALNEQYHQRTGEVSHGLNMLDRVGAELAEYVELLESDKLEIETQATIIFAVAGPTAQDAITQGRALAEWFQDADYVLGAPLGLQTDLWQAMHPGLPATAAVRDYAQITTSRNLAATVPLASSRLGDSKGSLLGLNITSGPLLATNVPCGPTGTVMHDLEGASDRNVSGSVAVAGELGAGKTATLMALGSDVIDRRGQLIIADRTTKGEWATWAEGLTDTVVVDALTPSLSLDPLRLFGPAKGGRIFQSFLTPLLNVAPTSSTGVVLSEVLDPGYARSHDIDSAGALITHLEADSCRLQGARDLAALINVFARKDIGAAIFNPAVPAVDLGTRGIVVRTNGLQMPGREELEHEHLFRQLSLEKIYGRAFNALVAALAREIAFADTSTLAGFVVSEAHSMTISFEGERELVDIVRDGRKHRALVLLDSHDPEADFGSPTLRGLIPTRILMRHRDKTLAKRGLDWLDLDPTDDDLLDMVMNGTSPVGADGYVPEHRRGEGTMRDSVGNIGRIKVLLPMRAGRYDAVRQAGSAQTRAHLRKAV